MHFKVKKNEQIIEYKTRKKSMFLSYCTSIKIDNLRISDLILIGEDNRIIINKSVLNINNINNNPVNTLISFILLEIKKISYNFINNSC